MEVKIRFLGLLSVRYGQDPIILNTDPSGDALRSKIVDLIGDPGLNSIVILRNGKTLLFADTIEDGDEFQILMPISGG